MALFNQSSKTCSAVVDEIADSVGASSDGEMRTRAFRSLAAGIEHFNTRANWEFMLTEADPIGLAAPFNVGGVTASAGQTSALAPAGHGILVDDLISMGGVILGTRVSATAAGSFGINIALTSSIGAGSVVMTANIVRDLYTLPSAYRAPYSAALLVAQSTLRIYRSRFYVRSNNQPYSASTPVGYDVFAVPSKGKLKIRQPPSQADMLILSYYRRMYVPTAASDSTTLDILQDYEPYLIAWAKAHLIVDKSEGRSEQMATWFTFADAGIKTMLADQVRIPDEDLQFTPGHYTYDPSRSPNSTREIDWGY